MGNQIKYYFIAKNNIFTFNFTVVLQFNVFMNEIFCDEKIV